MNREVWQRLLALESRDIVTNWFRSIHARDLSAKRAKEINASARQSREFFRNASASNYSVRPLLTFYGVASLARAITLLFKREGGEESLTRGHGLETINWSIQFSGDLSIGLGLLTEIKVRTKRGLFSDLANATNNRVSIHTNSAAVDWRLCYAKPNFDVEISFGELLARIPDLRKDQSIVGMVAKYSSINEMTYEPTQGFEAKISSEPFCNFRELYSAIGYQLQSEGRWVTMKANPEVFAKNPPQFMHAYIEKTFQVIPNLFVAAPLSSGNRYSQLCITYLVAYILGMLARYYPTYWVSLSQGEKGDELWPIVNQAQNFVENSFPEIVIELVDDVLKNPM